MDQIPVIDVSGIVSRTSKGDVKFVEASRLIDQACRNIGFFYITNHGIAKEKIDKAFQRAKEFFELPASQKLEVDINKSDNHRGYTALGAEKLGDPSDLKEGLDFGIEMSIDDPDVKNTPNQGPNQFPPSLGEEWKKDVLDFQDLLLDLARKILRAFAFNLKVEDDFFVKMYEKPNILTRFLKYSPASQKTFQNQLGCGAHTDYGFLTLLIQDQVGGLEVMNREGEWVKAHPISDAIVVNMG
eukprot:TRINITY_DN3664_c0_g3_i2.p1 TRINITY_DN3664_c0_g3~~TRINITY_DN3664_c0_g3_i2.p1  ORF type:complete len:242 (+),score=75.79 TRINITY_DN3664_c0_g3_i2:3-728(+)